MVLTKKKLIDIAKEMDIKGITKMTKQQLVEYIVNNPCVNITKDECDKMNREDLRVIARKCNVLLGKKKQEIICMEIINKFKDKKKTLDDIGGKNAHKKATQVKKTPTHMELIKQKPEKNKMKSISIVKIPEIFKQKSKSETFKKSPIVVSNTGEIFINGKSIGSGSNKSITKEISNPNNKPSNKISIIQNNSDDTSLLNDSDDIVEDESKLDLNKEKKSKKSTIDLIKSKSQLIKPSLPKAQKEDAESFPQITKEIYIKTNKSPKNLIKEIITNELSKDKSTNFTDSIKINKLGAKTYTTKTCNIQVESFKPLSHNMGISGAGIFLGMMKAVNKQSPNVVLKLWKYNTKIGLHNQLECLDAEWNIYTYIIPFMFFSNMTPNVLFPIESGTCKLNELTKIITNVKMTNQEVAKFILTPYIKYSLVDIFNSKQYYKQIDIRNIIFQLIYTIGAFNKMGMRHNDCHTNNIRIVPCPTNPFKICFKVKKTLVYALVPFLAVFNDFDRTSIGSPISNVTKLKNPCTAPGGYYCNYIHQCDTYVGGARDMLIVVFYTYDGMDPEMRHYFYTKLFTSTSWAKNHLSTYVKFKHTGEIDWTFTAHDKFLYTKLSDNDLVKYFPNVDSILNDPQFLNLCFASSTMKPTADDTSAYKVYDFYSTNVIKDYPIFKSKFYA